MHAAKAHESLGIRAATPKPALPDNAIHTKISCAGPYITSDEIAKDFPKWIMCLPSIYHI